MPRVALFGGVSARAFGLNGSRAFFKVGASPGTASGSGGPGGSINTNSVTVSQVSGDPSTLTGITWARFSGDTSIAANSPSSLTTSFRGTPPGESSSVSGVMRGTVSNDLGQTDFVDVPVNVSAGLAALNVTISPAAGSANPPSGSSYSFGVSVSVSNGTPPYTYSWSPSDRVSPLNTASATYTAPSHAPGDETCIYTCTVTDAIGRVGQNTGFFTLHWT